jgi:Domain of unknown function (DUF5916)
VWGLNLRRRITRKNETAYWQAVSRFDDTMRPSKSGTMNGLENLHAGHDLELIPFFSTNYRWASWQPELAGASSTAGLDMRYSIAPNLIANVTINPDFRETEADRFTSEISRYEIFFPEKRKFFTESANYFTTPMGLFFSRRIGQVLPDGEPQRVLEGGKITGKSAVWTIGALEALTQATDYRDPVTGLSQQAPAAFFGVARLEHSIFQKSTIGLISTNRIQSPAATYDADGKLVTASETAHGIDLHILSGDHISWASQLIANTNSLYPGFDLNTSDGLPISSTILKNSLSRRQVGFWAVTQTSVRSALSQRQTAGLARPTWSTNLSSTIGTFDKFLRASGIRNPMARVANSRTRVLSLTLTFNSRTSGSYN